MSYLQTLLPASVIIFCTEAGNFISTLIHSISYRLAINNLFKADNLTVF